MQTNIDKAQSTSFIKKSDPLTAVRESRAVHWMSLPLRNGLGGHNKEFEENSGKFPGYLQIYVMRAILYFKDFLQQIFYYV